MVKSLPAVQETQLSSLGLEDPLEKGMATHSGILAWRIPRTEELADYSPRIDRVTNTTAWERIGASLDPLSPSTCLVTFVCVGLGVLPSHGLSRNDECSKENGS